MTFPPFYRSIEKDSKASAKRDYEQEQDESLSSSGKRRRVQHGPAPTKKGDAEGKPRRPLSSSPRNVAARLQREELANSLATLKAELPPYPTNRTQVRVLEDAVGYIQKLKRLYRAGMIEEEMRYHEERMKALFEKLHQHHYAFSR